MDAMIFIDTNIFLDFYRVRSGGVGLELLSLIDQHKDVIITSSQVEMEYKKNRQRVILETLKAQKLPDWGGLTPPAFLADAKPAKVISKATKLIKTRQEKVKIRIAAILERPSKIDKVYRTLQRLFKHKQSPYNLTRDKKIRFEIRRLARKRFFLGYPPRKQNDTSMGDAVNWEWIVECARKCNKHVILVTRDTDYGVCHDDTFYLNDWLKQEFAERVSRKRKLVLTDKLSEAFKLISVPVSPEAAKEEEELLEAIRQEILRQLKAEFFSGSTLGISKPEGK